MRFLIKLVATKSCKFLVYRLEVFKVLHKGNSALVDKIGYYIMDNSNKIISLNLQKLGFWLNKGAFLNLSIFRLLKKFIAKI